MTVAGSRDPVVDPARRIQSPRMTIYTEPNLRAPLILKGLIDRNRVRGFAHSHPLAPGYSAIDKRLRGEALTTSEIRDVSALQLFAEAVVDHLYQRGNDSELRGHLASSKSCRALWFEALVLKLVVEPNVREVRWRRYDSGVTDIVGLDPAVQVECKLVTEPSFPRMLDRVSHRIDQYRNGDGPFVIVVGTDVPFDDVSIANATGLIDKQQRQWFGRHPEISAALLLMPRSRAAEWSDAGLGLNGLMYNQLSALWLRNNKANEPLPPHFDTEARGTTS